MQTHPVASDPVPGRAPSGAADGEAAPQTSDSTGRQRRKRRRVVAALLAAAAGIGVLVVLSVAWVYPLLSPALTALAVLVGAFALVGAVRVDRIGLAAEVETLRAENRRLSARLEGLADTAWELRESEERYLSLLDARHKAEAANQAKSRVLATVSHEFRTPLNGILGLAGLLAETELSPDQRTYVRAVQTSGEALLALVDDMLDFSRIEAGRLDLRPEPTDLEALVQEIAELVAGRAHAKGIDLAVEVGRGLPAAVAVDATRLRQVLINLAGNGIKFTEVGGVTLSVERSAVGRGIVFAVSDSGPGVPPDEAERLFGEFEQLDRAPGRRHGGVGLGLAISRQIVRRMGGELTVGTRDGGGAVFSFTLDLPEAAGAPDSPVGPPAIGDLSVLVLSSADAEPRALARVLTDAGARVRLTRTASEAAGVLGAAAAAGELHGAVLVDARIASDPGAVLSRIREAAGSDIPAVVLIEPGRRGEIERLRRAGYDAYLVRPVRRLSLLRIVGDIARGFDSARTFRVDPVDARQARGPSGRAVTGRDVLLVEDNEINALLARAVLEGLGHTVTEVHDGAAAVAAVRNQKPGFAAIVMDLHMPGLDGLAAAREIRAIESEAGRTRTAILAVTADVLAETRLAAARAGIDAVLAKPVTPDALRRGLAGLTAD